MPHRSIVLIDDSKMDLRLCEMAMVGLHINRSVITHSNAESAYTYIAENAADIFVIICDIKMPGMTGIDLLEKINEDKVLRMQAIPFIFLSNSDTPQDITDAYKQAAQGYFVKPMQVDALQLIFQHILSYWSASRVPPFQSGIA